MTTRADRERAALLFLERMDAGDAESLLGLLDSVHRATAEECARACEVVADAVYPYGHFVADDCAVACRKVGES